MAYKPKYAQSKKAQPDYRSQPQPVEDAPKPQKQRGKVGKILVVLLGLVLIPASVYLSGKLLGRMFLDLGRPKAAEVSQTQDMTIVRDFDAAISAALLHARNVVTGEETEDGGESAVRKVYWIEDDVQVAPSPDQSKFGETTDPNKLQEVLTAAQTLLEGQTTYFQPDQELYQDSTVRYYLDDSIFAITWKEVHNGSVYTFSEIKVSHPSQFRRHLAGGEYGSDMQFLTTEMAQSVNAVVASAGDFYRFRDFGTVVYQGQARRVEGTYAETCYIDRSGDMHFTRAGEVMTVEDAQAFVEEKDIWFSLAFGPILVENSEIVPHSWYGVGEIDEGYARAALCQMDTLHYIVAAANTTGPYQEIPTVATFARNIAATGCKMAYCLDGGQTATIVMNDQLINRPVYGQQRKISDIIYFATAVPEGGFQNG